MKLIIFGTSEIAKCAYEYFTHDSDYEVIAFTVDAAFTNGSDNFLNLPLIPFENLTASYNPRHVSAFAAIGSQQLNRLRTVKYKALKKLGYNIASYVSSRIFKWHNVTIGEHAFILENNTLQPFVNIGNNVTLWSGNHIGHSSIIEDNCFITSHVVTSGGCKIGMNSFIGVNAAISEGIHIGADNYIGMQSKICNSTTNDQLISTDKCKISSITAKRFCGVQEFAET